MGARRQGRARALAATLALAAAAASGACGRVVSEPAAPEPAPIPDPDAPSIAPRAVPAGDCHRPPGAAPVRLYTPWAPPRGWAKGGGRILRAGKEIYAGLVPSAETTRVTIYRAAAAPTARWTPWAAEIEDLGPMQMGDRLYWPSRASASSVLELAFRGSDGSVVPVPGTDNELSFAVDGAVAYTFDLRWCPTTTPCPLYEMISAVDLARGEVIWSQPFDRHGFHPAIDDRTIHFLTNWDVKQQTQRTRLFTMPRSGGPPVEIPVVFEVPDLDVGGAAIDGGELVLDAHGRRDPVSGAAEVLRLALPLPLDPKTAPTVRRVSFGTTAVGSYRTFDRESVYYTIDEPPVRGKPQAQRLMRACKDGSNPVKILDGVSTNAASQNPEAFSIDGLANDDGRVFFTSGNAVWSIDK